MSLLLPNSPDSDDLLGRTLQCQRRLHQILANVNAGLPLDDILRQVRDAAVECAGFDRAGVLLLEEHDQPPALRGSWGTDEYGKARDERQTYFPLDPHIRLLLAPEAPPSVFIPNHDGFVLPADWAGRRVADAARLALRTGSELVGILSVDNLISGRPIQPSDLEMLLPFCDATACAVLLMRRRDALIERTRASAEQTTLLDTLLRTAPVGFAFLDRDLRYRRINDVMAALNGRSVSDTLGQTLQEIAPNFATVFEPLIQKVLQTGRPLIGHEMRGRRQADGRRRHYLVSIYPVYLERDEAGKQTDGAGVVLTEITAQRQTEERLRESEAKFRLLFENNPLPMWVYDRQTLQFLEVNDAAVRHYGYSRTEFLRMQMPDVGTPDERARFLRENNQPEDVPIEYRDLWQHQDRRGRRFDVEVTAHHVEWSGNPAAMMMVRDITDQRRREAEQQRLAERDRRIADTLQRSLLRMSATPQDHLGLDIEPFYRAAAEEALVGGDFFDVFTLSDRRVALAVGDTIGKGLVAAAHVAELKYVLRAFLRETGDVADTLTRLNNHLCLSHGRNSGSNGSSGDHNAPESVLAALALVVIDPRTGDLLLGTAGAEPPILLREDGGCAVLPERSGGMLLGALPDQVYDAAPEVLGAADILLLTTDGLTEARRPGGECYGMPRLVERTAAARASRRLRAVGETVIADAQMWAGGRLPDDVCVLLTRRTAYRSPIGALPLSFQRAEPLPARDR